MSTIASQLGQHFMFQKFEQTMINLIFDTMDLHNGIKLMRGLRFIQKRIMFAFHYSVLSSTTNNIAMFWCFCYLVFLFSLILKNYLFCNLFP